jgi:hypothetical protein
MSYSGKYMRNIVLSLKELADNEVLTYFIENSKRESQRM